MVRVLNMIRRANGELKLCNLPEHLHKVLQMANLTKVFETHESEEKAVAALYGSGVRAAAPAHAVPGRMGLEKCARLGRIAEFA